MFNLSIPTEKPKNYCHIKYRLFQINQPFKNNNIILTVNQYQILTITRIIS